MGRQLAYTAVSNPGQAYMETSAAPGGTQIKVRAPAERATLRLACTTLLPTLAPEPEEDDNPHLFALNGPALGVPEAMEQAIALLGSEQRLQFRLLLCP